MTGFRSYNRNIYVLCLMLLSGLMMVGCGSSEGEQQETLENLEVRYKELLSSTASGKDQQEVIATMKELASAYEKRGTESSDNTQAVEDLYRAAELYENSRDINKVIQLFDQIIHNYPQHERAADAMFKKGFVFHNIIGDTAKARVAYNEFLDQFPDDPLAEDARMELKYLGMDPGELLEMIQKENQAEEN